MTFPLEKPLIQQARQLAEVISTPGSALEHPESFALKLLDQLEAWALGVWLVEGEFLKQFLFVRHHQFDFQVALDFQQATVHVPLDQTQLGIVNAVVNQRPALAVASEQTGDLQKSAGWLERFGAACSLSVPIITTQKQSVAVLAVAWKDLLSETDPPAQRLLTFCENVAHFLEQYP